MNETMQRFFQKIDEALVPLANGQRLDLYHLGRSALVWRFQATFSTKDIDVVQRGTPLEAKARELFGQGSAKAKELGLYLDLVHEGLPSLPGAFRPQDRQDLRFLCDQGALQADKLRESLEKVWIWTMEKDGDPLRDAAFTNLEIVIAYLEGRSANL